MISISIIDFCIFLFIYRSPRSATLKAVDAAIQSRQWNKAIGILESQDPKIAAKYYKQIADHYCAVGDFERAEQYFMAAGCSRETIEMYNKAGMWEEAHRVS